MFGNYIARSRVNRLLMSGAVIVAVLFAVPSLAVSAQETQDPHHVQGQPDVTVEPGDNDVQMGGKAATAGGQAAMPNMMKMMEMMQMMSGPGDGAANMMPCMADMIAMDHIEGRLAFLRTELKITDAQLEVWNQFANATRMSAQQIGDVRRAAMMMSDGEQMLDLSKKLDMQEQLLNVRLALVRAQKALYSALAEDQKKLAEKLSMGRMHLGVGSMMPM